MIYFETLDHKFFTRYNKRMEHAVPQNVTSFQFHLVGDMTLKQFAYLGTGLGIAYLLFIFLFPLSPFLAAPIMVFAAISGAAFAFVPILDRPLDHWAAAFFRAVYSPTQAKWKSPVKERPELVINRLQLYLSPALTPRLSRLAPPKANPAPPPPAPISASSAPSVPTIPSSQDLAKLVNMAKEVQVLQAKITQTEKQLETLKMETQAQSKQTPEHDQKLQEASVNLQNLIKQTGDLYEQTSALSRLAPIHPKSPEVVVVEPAKPQKTTLLLTSWPNVVNGIITDHSGSYLDGVIVIIHDKDSIPVRALKTNKLGQFTGATPLPAGVYTLTLEKEGFEFDTLQITLNDEIMTPLKIQPKKGNQ